MNVFSQDNETRLQELLDQEIELLKRVCELTEKQARLLKEYDIYAYAFDSSLYSSVDSSVNNFVDSSVNSSVDSPPDGLLNNSLDSMRKLIETINGLHQESDILMQSYAYFTGMEAGEKIEEIEKAVALRQDLLSGCTALNEKNTIEAKEKAEGYIKRIGKLRQRRKSMKLYTPYILNNSELLDKKM